MAFAGSVPGGVSLEDLTLTTSTSVTDLISQVILIAFPYFLTGASLSSLSSLKRVHRGSSTPCPPCIETR